jgi:hypothetical protein
LDHGLDVQDALEDRRRKPARRASSARARAELVDASSFSTTSGLASEFCRAPRLDPRFGGDDTCSLVRSLGTFIFARREYSDVAASLPSDGLRADHPGGELLIGARTAAFQHGVKEPTIIDAYYKENP